jgi:hypothetical protein
VAVERQSFTVNAEFASIPVGVSATTIEECPPRRKLRVGPFTFEYPICFAVLRTETIPFSFRIRLDTPSGPVAGVVPLTDGCRTAFKVSNVAYTQVVEVCFSGVTYTGSNAVAFNFKAIAHLDLPWPIGRKDETIYEDHMRALFDLPRKAFEELAAHPNVTFGPEMSVEEGNVLHLLMPGGWISSG